MPHPLPDTVEHWPLDRLRPYDRNARTHSDGQVAQIAASVIEFGFTNPILADGQGNIIAGHGRLAAAKSLGLDTVPVVILDHLTEAQRRAYILADNKLALNAGWDEETLAAELHALNGDGYDLGVIGFSDEELDALMAPLDDEGDGQGEGDEDEIPEPPADPVTRPGDLWILGKHRLLCGDSTSATDVERLLGGAKPHLMATDPPYGVQYDPTWRNEAGVSSSARTGKVANDDRADWREAWALFPGEVAYVWHAAIFAKIVADSLEANDFKIRAQIIWSKNRFVLGRGDYHWQHEPCQPAGTMVQKVIERGSGSQPARIAEVPIETLRAGDYVVSYNSYESVVRRRGRQITRFGDRQFEGFMHTISAGGRVTRATPEHRFTARLNPDASDKQVVYLMRRGDWWRVGRVALFNSRGFGLATRLADNKAEEAWIVSVHDSAVEAQCMEQILSCRYGIPTTHWEVDSWAPERTRSPEMIASIYASLNLSALTARATLLLRDHRLERDHPFIAADDQLMFSRKATRLVRACNLHAKIMQIPRPTTGDDFEWLAVTGNDATPFSGLVYSMDVDKDLHYVADGLITHNCWYAVRKTGTGHWQGARDQATVWAIGNNGDEDEATVHGTQKPVECMRRPILNNSAEGDGVYEPFAGSGTTVIAAETTGRICFAMELNPAYADVIVGRWQKLTAQKAVLDGDGRNFDDLSAERKP
ncbi:ParB domain protein nuclease [Magnetospirillum sp. LM-5]|uniref:site-specific DNA-methyltransferase n=1 Tax=Magnetospirillum sp. LM-5 TaxID=2681466 RepID=UPI00137D686F|nr:site-specific DNA-methyltransferase [Magnetospirillum sp. LM-5]CAA7618922.1 ParB domain protein nuclease [Magnetospirillum sp. LM-5]